MRQGSNVTPGAVGSRRDGDGGGRCTGAVVTGTGRRRRAFRWKVYSPGSKAYLAGTLTFASAGP